MMAGESRHPEYDVRFENIESHLGTIKRLAESTDRAIRGENGTPGLTAAVSANTAAVKDHARKIERLEGAPREVQDALISAMGGMESRLEAKIKAAKGSVKSSSSPEKSVSAWSTERKALISIIVSLVGILAAVVGVG